MEEEVVNKKTEEGKKKNRTSLKSILGGDILATDFSAVKRSCWYLSWYSSSSTFTIVMPVNNNRLR